MSKPLIIRQLTNEEINKRLASLPGQYNVFKDGFRVSYHADRDFFQKRLITLGAPYRVTENRIILITHGSATLRSNLLQWEVSPHNLFILRQGMLVEVFSFSEDFRCDIIAHTEEALIVPSKFMPASTMILLNNEEFTNVQRYRMLLASMLKCNPTPMDALRLTIQSLYSFACSIDNGGIQTHEHHQDNRPRELCAKFLDMVTNDHIQKRSLTYYASRLNISAHYLCNTVSATSGQSPKHWIDQALLQDVKYRLAYTPDTIVKISQDLNFSNPAFFNRFFQHHMNMSPGAYRKLVHKGLEDII